LIEKHRREGILTSATRIDPGRCEEGECKLSRISGQKKGGKPTDQFLGYGVVVPNSGFGLREVRISGITSETYALTAKLVLKELPTTVGGAPEAAGPEIVSILDWKAEVK